MPTLNLSDLNVVTAVLGAFTLLYGIISVKIKQAWYLGEALPAMVLGIILGPVAARFLDASRWGLAEEAQVSEITLGVTRIVICLQLVIAAYQLPQKYFWIRKKEMLICLIPIMTLMWLLTTACCLATIPKITFLAGLAIAAACTCTDPVLSQAVAKGPFSDKYVSRPLREIISAEACLNDGFGFPFLMLAVYLLRHAEPIPEPLDAVGGAHRLMIRSGSEHEVGRLGGGPGEAMKQWFLETWLYYVILSAVYGVAVGTVARLAIKFSLRKRWIDSESYVLFPTAIGLFIVGTAGAVGTNDLLACAFSGGALNWDGEFMDELERRHDEVNSCIDVLLNFGGFMYLGAIIPWSEFHDPDGTGITIWRLFLLGIMVFAFRRIPAIFICYKTMPNIVQNWREALFMGYFGPIGIGAVFYVEHTRHIVPKPGEADSEFDNMIRALPGTIYFLVVFSIVGHGLSIPLLDAIYKRMGVQPIQDDAIAIRRKSIHVPNPANAALGDEDTFIAYNRFRRPSDPEAQPRRHSRRVSHSRAAVRPPNYPEEDSEAEKKRLQRRTIRYGV
ncbi:Sodium/hydrogen exchanger family-domain-containing protein [Emericellopsis atlantica]|uniref:Sodium/hydrogen exchanger family-domain-containing protein n=1 Tax=Emericellopsis atlantica TaxID=2614577 RepID=A0A9P7ZF91_9HYPO|nr:Sodium/hydrogen exchanger family-domain-containing protein [Emericellopsis atlantica]KAG9251059.1 Sodium/hydrogen exchanger family-domain-containing protein [Emericellopsis atlantica]